MSTVVEKQTETVFKHHLEAFGAKDIDAVMEDFTEDSVVIESMAPEAAHGLAAIRAFFTQAMEGFTPEVLTSIKVHRLEVHGEVAYMVWSAGEAFPFATDTFVIRNGTIVAKTAAAYLPQDG